MLEVDTTTYLPDDLLTKIDIATMAHGLEARSPFLDHELLELSAAIPAALKVRGSEKKWILREALRAGCPTTSSTGPSRGFRFRSATGSAATCATTLARSCWIARHSGAAGFASARSAACSTGTTPVPTARRHACGRS